MMHWHSAGILVAARRLKRRAPRRFVNAGFTLVELVTVILVLGVLAVGVSSFIIFGTRIFVDSTAVEQVTGEGRYAIERMTRDIRRALPASLRLGSGSDASDSWQCLELVPVAASSSYLSLAIAPEPPAQTAKLLRDEPVTAIAAGQWAHVYPLISADVYAGVSSNTAKRFRVTSITEGAADIELDFGAPVRFAEASPRRRMYFSDTVISYCVIERLADHNISLWRYAGYGLTAIQQSPPQMAAAGSAALMARSLTTPAPLALQVPTLLNNAVVQLDLGFAVLGQSFQYQHQVQVINVP